MTGFSLSGALDSVGSALNAANNYAADAGAAVNHLFGGSAPGGALPGAGQTTAGAAAAQAGATSSSMNSGLLQVFVNAISVIIGIVLIMAALRGDTITNIAIRTGKRLAE